jgi:broad specificity phosphatase PhoE
MRFHLLRHGESVSNAAAGVVALPEAEGDRLSPLGQRQAEAAGAPRAARGGPRGPRVASPMGRAQQTAEVVAGALGLAVETWEDIHELREPDGYYALGETEQQRARWSNRMREHADDPGHAPDGGESFAGLLERVQAALDRLVAEDVHETLLVGHGIFARFTFARTMLGDAFTPAAIDSLWRIGSLNCGLSTFEHVRNDGSANPADIDGWRCVTWMAPLLDPAEVTGTGGGGAGN